MSSRLSTLLNFPDEMPFGGPEASLTLDAPLEAPMTTEASSLEMPSSGPFGADFLTFGKYEDGEFEKAFVGRKMRGSVAEDTLESANLGLRNGTRVDRLESPDLITLDPRSINSSFAIKRPVDDDAELERDVKRLRRPSTPETASDTGDAIEGMIGDIHSRLKDAESRADKAERRINSLVKAKGELLAQLEDTKTEAAEKERTARKIVGKAKEHVKKEKEWRERAERAEKELKEVERREAERMDQYGGNSKPAERIRALETEVADARRRIASLERELEETKDNYGDAVVCVQEQDVEIAHLEKELDGMRDKVKDLEGSKNRWIAALDLMSQLGRTSLGIPPTSAPPGPGVRRNSPVPVSDNDSDSTSSDSEASEVGRPAIKRDPTESDDSESNTSTRLQSPKPTGLRVRLPISKPVEIPLLGGSSAFSPDDTQLETPKPELFRIAEGNPT